MGDKLIALFFFAAVAIAHAAENTSTESDPNAPLNRYAKAYLGQCAVCHGADLRGAAQGTPLVGDLKNGESVTDLIASISNGNPSKGMPVWSQTLSAEDIKAMALYISETRAGFSYASFNYDTAFVVPTDAYTTEKHAFNLKVIAHGLDALPFSIAPLPEGGMLLTEKKIGLSIISPAGEKSDFITNTPQAYADTYTLDIKQEWGYGWLLDVALHPKYEENGWVYLYFGDRCEDCNAISRESKTPVSMNKLVRGRIADGAWTDQEVIWESAIEHYGSIPDIGAGGRLAFDGKGHLFMTVGLTGNDNFTGIQDLGRPWGKIHRIKDNGEIPLDNPFMETEGALKTIWTYGHRSPQGLEFNQATGEVWGTEMGPRGGDEVNRLRPGRNYGWPLYSKGINYDGTPIAYGKQLGIEFDLKDIVQPVVDLTPSPAVSSFIFYNGDKFPEWRGDLLVGSLKGRTLYRMEVVDNVVVHTEALISNLTRFRDIETGPNGEIYVLLEHNSGGQILELVHQPEES